ncbi:MAG: cation transporter [Burkholderiales bacterium]
MSIGCCGASCTSQTTISPRFRKALWVALVINAVMFAVEIVGGFKSGSVSLLADAVDFAADAANYGISLAVFSMGATSRAHAALVKGRSMAVFGLFVLGKTVWAAIGGVPPEPLTMGAIAVLALAANGSVALMLYAFRNGDANMRSVWLCSRNDAIGNVAVMLAAVGVFGIGSRWPDLVVALLMGGLAVFSGGSVIRHAHKELSRPHKSSVQHATVHLASRSDPGM